MVAKPSKLRVFSNISFPECEPGNSIEFYCDGSFYGGKGAWAVVVVSNDKVVAEYAEPFNANNSLESELHALLVALSSAKLNPGTHDITLFTDNEIAVQSIALNGSSRDLWSHVRNRGWSNSLFEIIQSEDWIAYWAQQYQSSPPSQRLRIQQIRRNSISWHSRADYVATRTCKGQLVSRKGLSNHWKKAAKTSSPVDLVPIEAVKTIREPYFTEEGFKLDPCQIYVFSFAGSYPDSMIRLGAEYGTHRRLKGQVYALQTRYPITRDSPTACPVPLDDIKKQLADLLAFAQVKPHLTFLIPTIDARNSPYSEAQLLSLWDGLPLPSNIAISKRLKARLIDRQQQRSLLLQHI